MKLGLITDIHEQVELLRLALDRFANGQVDQVVVIGDVCEVGNLPNELVQTLLQAANLRIERIISNGHTSPEGFWYDQDQHEWVILLKGAARLTIGSETRALQPGDFVNIPAHQKHRVEWTTPDEPTIWLAVFYGDGKA